MLVTQTCRAESSSSRPLTVCTVVSTRIRSTSDTTFAAMITVASARLAMRDQRVSVVSRVGFTETSEASSANSTAGISQRGSISSRPGRTA